MPPLFGEFARTFRGRGVPARAGLAPGAILRYESGVTRYERPVRFEDVDAAQIVFFPRFFSYCHEAMEALFAPLDGGYVRLIRERKIGLPAVHVAADFKAPMLYGDTAQIEVTVPKVGTTSCTLAYRILRAKDGVLAATVTHVCVVSDLTTLSKITIPDDLRAVLVQNRA
jgi:4-hydroxybenzoyl-CoA thioesterase